MVQVRCGTGKASLAKVFSSLYFQRPWGYTQQGPGPQSAGTAFYPDRATTPSAQNSSLSTCLLITERQLWPLITPTKPHSANFPPPFPPVTEKERLVITGGGIYVVIHRQSCRKISCFSLSGLLYSILLSPS